MCLNSHNNFNQAHELQIITANPAPKAPSLPSTKRQLTRSTSLQNPRSLLQSTTLLTKVPHHKQPGEPGLRPFSLQLNRVQPSRAEDGFRSADDRGQVEEVGEQCGTKADQYGMWVT